MDTTPPRIEFIDRTNVSLSSRVVMPRRIRAHFDRTPAVAVEIEVVDGIPVVRAVTIWSTSDHLVSNDLRLPLSGELVPAAVRAACSTVLFGPTPDEYNDLAQPDGVEPGGIGVIGPISLVAQIRRDLDKYKQAAMASQPRKRGRPPKQIPDAELVEIAKTYKQTNSYVDTALAHYMSESTARRRVKRARDAGIDC